MLDCACGIGTQALGLAAVGYTVEGSDAAPAAVARAAREARARGLAAEFRVDDMCRLAAALPARYGAVRSRLFLPLPGVAACRAEAQGTALRKRTGPRRSVTTGEARYTSRRRSVR